VIRVQLISILTYGLIAWWYVAPWLNKLQRSQALTALLWVHVFRYVVLYLYVAQREGYPISANAVDIEEFSEAIGTPIPGCYSAVSWSGEKDCRSRDVLG
jgi:hypothetical protein